MPLGGIEWVEIMAAASPSALALLSSPLHAQ